jgi:hypothetical protein
MSTTARVGVFVCVFHFTYSYLPMSQTSQGWNKMNKKRIYEKPLIYQTHTHTHVCMFLQSIQLHTLSLHHSSLEFFVAFLSFSTYLVRMRKMRKRDENFSEDMKANETKK